MNLFVIFSSIVPAASPALKIGRIRVDCADATLRGYVSTSFVDNYGWCCVYRDGSAAIFEYDRVRGEIKFKVDFGRQKKLSVPF